MLTLIFATNRGLWFYRLVYLPSPSLRWAHWQRTLFSAERRAHDLASDSSIPYVRRSASLPWNRVLAVRFRATFHKSHWSQYRDVYHFPKRPGGTEFSESWWLARWQEPIQSVAFFLVPIGIAWALVNAATDRERKANLVGLAAGVGLVVLSVFLTATFGSFF